MVAPTHTNTQTHRPFKAGLFSQALRRRCFNEHLGFLATDDDNYEEPLEPVDSSDEHGDRVADVCSSDFFEDIWLKTATVNTDTYEKVRYRSGKV